MKYSWISLLLLVPVFAIAQQKDVEPAPPSSQEQVRRILVPGPGLLPQARYSHKTSRGLIYTMPIDNMPCLVPDVDVSKKMPNARPAYPVPSIPNIYPKYDVIPKKRPDNPPNK